VLTSFKSRSEVFAQQTSLLFTPELTAYRNAIDGALFTATPSHPDRRLAPIGCRMSAPTVPACSRVRVMFVLDASVVSERSVSLIAATARVHRMIVVTRDTKGFPRFDGLDAFEPGTS
jgi:hypothetical protein